jgi:hypothetical protein
MSSITFPHSDHASGPSSAHDQYYAPPFDASSSFHMNPLSSHPPRTPRTSIISSSSHTYNSSLFESKEEPQVHAVVETDDDEDEDDHKGNSKTQEVEDHVRREAVWRELFLTSNGRDKAFVGPLRRLE